MTNRIFETDKNQFLRLVIKVRRNDIFLWNIINVPAAR